MKHSKHLFQVICLIHSLLPVFCSDETDTVPSVLFRLIQSFVRNLMNRPGTHALRDRYTPG